MKFPLHLRVTMTNCRSDHVKCLSEIPEYHIFWSNCDVIASYLACRYSGSLLFGRGRWPRSYTGSTCTRWCPARSAAPRNPAGTYTGTNPWCLYTSLRAHTGWNLYRQINTLTLTFLLTGRRVRTRPNKDQFDWKEMTMRWFGWFRVVWRSQTKASTVCDYSNNTPEGVIYCDYGHNYGYRSTHNNRKECARIWLV